MIQDYLICALWSSTDESTPEGVPIDLNYSIDDIDPESLKKAEIDCESFLEKAMALKILPETARLKRVGHDFWLTRNRHGAGFWDDYNGEHYETQENAEALTDLAHSFGEVHIFVQDGKVYFEGEK